MIDEIGWMECLAARLSRVPGSGTRATAGGAPPATAASRAVSMLEPLPVYWTLMPVESSNGANTALKSCCSVLVHSAQSVTEPPILCDVTATAGPFDTATDKAAIVVTATVVSNAFRVVVDLVNSFIL